MATPIGTLADFSTRAGEILAAADVVLAEDTRRAGKLISQLGIQMRGTIVSHHEHNEERQVQQLVGRLQEGASMVLLSDAGTPVLSDPGFKLVRAARELGLTIMSVPGPSSFTAALAVSGQPPLPATLSGFLPARPGPRRRRIRELARCPWTQVVLLSPHRLRKELADLAAELGGDRPATLLAELSKKYERAQASNLAQLAVCYEAVRPRGEYVLVIGPPRGDPERPAPSREAVEAEYAGALDEGLSRGDAMRRTARVFGLKKRDVFDLLSGGANRRQAGEDGSE
jgi:16S rRNA (cytidine1402-2'-O)-methyltransferase